MVRYIHGMNLAVQNLWKGMFVKEFLMVSDILVHDSLITGETAAGLGVQGQPVLHGEDVSNKGLLDGKSY